MNAQTPLTTYDGKFPCTKCGFRFNLNGYIGENPVCTRCRTKKTPSTEVSLSVEELVRLRVENELLKKENQQQNAEIQRLNAEIAQLKALKPKSNDSRSKQDKSPKSNSSEKHAYIPGRCGTCWDKFGKCPKCLAKEKSQQPVHSPTDADRKAFVSDWADAV